MPSAPTPNEGPNRPSRATVSRLAFVAIDLLDAACAAANYDPIERTITHRLALGYLMLTGVTAPTQATLVWKIMGHEGVYDQMSCRQSHSGVIIDGMRERAKAIAPGAAQKSKVD